MEFRVGFNYRLGRKVGGGAFGEIYIGTDITTGFIGLDVCDA